MTHEEFIDKIDEIARLKTQLATLTVEREALIAQINERFKEPSESLQKGIKSLTGECHEHAKKHRQQIFGTEKKSAETALAVFSMYQGPPKLKPFSNQTWEKIFLRVQSKRRVEYIATVPELNREKIKSDMLAKNWKKDPELKVRIVHEESFNVHPKLK